MGREADAERWALVVEDEVLLGMEAEDLLLAEGFRAIIATTAAEAEKIPPGLLTVAIVNIRLGDEIAGQKVIQALRRQTPNLPVVVLTGYDGQAPQADLRGLGGPTIRLRKPAAYGDLAAAVWAVINRAAGAAQPLADRRSARQVHE